MAMTAHGAFHWNELMTRSPDEARAFYAETLGWTYDAVPMAGGIVGWVTPAREW